MKRVASFFFLATAAACAMTAAVHADLIVTNTDDTGAGSLRQAIADADSGDTIVFDPSLAGSSIILGGSQLAITSKDVNIDASALPDGITIDAAKGSRVFFISHRFGAMTFDSLTLTGGNVDASGGGILVDRGTLTLNDVTVSGNHAYWGGGIYKTFGVVSLNNCSLVRNSVRFDGGGLYNAQIGTMILNNSTIFGNSAGGRGGGILQSPFSVLTLNNTTITGNNALIEGGGIFIASDSGSFSADVALNNTIVAGNTATEDTNIRGSIDSDNGFNLTSGDPRLASLGHYGGRTMTKPPLPDSPAVDTGGATTFVSDQRGLPRVIELPDIGAVEYQGASDFALYWPLDFDGDGSPFGVEHALGTDPLVFDADDPAKPAFSINAGGQTEITFGTIADDAIWVVRRSPDLVTFTEIYRYDGPGMMETLAPGISSTFNPPVDPTHITITDENPTEPDTYYRFEALLP